MPSVKTVERLPPMPKARVLAWLVQFAQTDVASLQGGPPGDLPNLIYELRQWLDLEPDEPLSRSVPELEAQPARLQPLVDRMAQLLEAVADGRRFEASYSGGSVILEAGRLRSEGGRALSYRDASLEDAILRLALDDLYENVKATGRIRRCPECSALFFATRVNQKYCCHACANKRASRLYRAAHGPERADRQHQRYERKLRERLGRNVKVRRRPRSSARP